LKTWIGFSSENKKCLFCNKVTTDYKQYEVDGISLKIHSHINCSIDIEVIAKRTFKQLKKDIKILHSQI
jgi:hypothetical protein